ncbi:type 1 glutamine amidotransferase domain-containing protein [uncultured Croceitalea sp.]|uniref:type 1 glutamine amidotransferase domain-containing protein n=1 Tax=uncultured Croceitalea sp. TaxID=1798908 RepID=UPI0033062ECD
MKNTVVLLIALTALSCAQKQSSVETASITEKTALSNSKKVLFVTSNARHYGNTNIETTNNFPEIVYAYHEFVTADVTVDVISPEGGQIPIGYINSSDTLLQKYLFNETLLQKLKNTLKPTEIAVGSYNAIYYVGGGSAMFTVPQNKAIQKIAQTIYEENSGIVAAICHGTAGIAKIQLSNGDFLVNGKSVSGFPDVFEDKSARYFQEFPFSIQEEIERNGGNFKYSDKGWDNFALSDDRLITGQDPTGSGTVAKMVIEKIQ